MGSLSEAALESRAADYSAAKMRPRFLRQPLLNPRQPRTVSDARASVRGRVEPLADLRPVASSSFHPMTRVLYTEHDYPDVNLERGVLAAADIELVLGNCKTDDELIAAGKDADAFLIQYAPITERVIVELPRLGLIS